MALPDPFPQEDLPLAELWTYLHTIQTDFCFNQELGVFYASPTWHAAKTVLDLGTGNGYYLNRLASYFTEKHYRGIDISPDYIEQASQTVTSPNIAFECQDLYQVQGMYDVVLSRLVFQHLDNVDQALKALANVLHPGGTAYIIDANDPARYFYPEPTEYVEFFKAYAAHQGQQGMNRNIASELQHAINQQGQFTCMNMENLLIPSTIDDNLSLFEKTYYLVVVMVEKTGGMDYDFGSVKKAWRLWCQAKKKYMQVGLKVLQLQKLPV
jgi:2-polyprenyl-3-methyl-5-hydroxy-6-metoxy-1,4-benzoquinol methylase